MILKRHITFKLRPYGTKRLVYQIQMHVTYDSGRVMLSTGCQVTSREAWDADNQLVVPGYRGPKGETDVEINNTLRKEKDQMDTAFKYYEVTEERPSLTQVVAQYQDRLNGKTPQKKEKGKKEISQRSQKKPDLFDVFHLFLAECSEKNAWTTATYKKMSALEGDLVSFKKDISFADLSESGLTAFVHYLRDEKTLRTPRKKKGERKAYDKEDITGLKNTTIKKKLELLTWFLNWASEHGYNTNMAYKSFHPTLKTTQKKVIYLSKPELERLKQLQIPSGLPHLEAVRDVFLFCCFSGLHKAGDIGPVGVGEIMLLQHGDFVKLIDHHNDSHGGKGIKPILAAQVTERNHSVIACSLHRQLRSAERAVNISHMSASQSFHFIV